MDTQTNTNPGRPARPLPDLTRTAAALELYDWMGAELDRCDAITDEMVEHLDTARRRVAVAYGLDTADRNNPVDCAASLMDESGLRFIRRMIALWRGGVA